MLDGKGCTAVGTKLSPTTDILPLSKRLIQAGVGVPAGCNRGYKGVFWGEEKDASFTLFLSFFLLFLL